MTHGRSAGTVRRWSTREGWGVIDTPDTPGGCRAQASVIQTDGDRELRAGQPVEVEWEAGDHDGFAYRALVVVPGDELASTPGA
jgi:CspA family cold shock protein